MILRAWSGYCIGVLLSIPLVRAAPEVVSVSPQAGFVTELSSVAVVFSEAVTGVRAVDFLVNGVPAEGVTGAGAAYTFTFAQPAFGGVDINWGTLHTITDLRNERFDGGAPGATWAYQLVNPAGPSVTNVVPVPGTVLRRLGAIEISFTEPVAGLDASDLLVNGQAATNVTGVGAGPFRFSFADAGTGEATISWDADHGIVSESPMPVAFSGASLAYRINPALPPPAIVINEFVAENQTGAADEENDPEDWIELHNRGAQPVDLGGWSLSVDRDEEGQWVFPPTIIGPGEFLVVWASGKDRRMPSGANRMHTNFKLNPNPDTLRLFGPELPRSLADEIRYPEQAPNYSYGRRIENGAGSWSFLATATPAGPNFSTALTGKAEEVHFSVERGFFNAPFALTLACPTPGAEIRYTTNGSPPSATNGIVYSSAIQISTTKIIRAAAFAPNQLPSRVSSHTYLMNLASNRRLLPVLSLVTATNNLYGRTGIMEYNPRNTTKHGAQWERPVSVEFIRPEDNSGFQLDAGLRVAGGDYIRGRYNYRQTSPPEGKYSFRLYFRGDYGPGRLDYRIFPGSTVESFNTLHLRAGMNDPTNPFIKDEFVRALSLDVGIPACHGTFVHLFLNGVYKGLYNPTERVDDDFLQAYHGGGEEWDVMGPNSAAIRGNATAWSQLRSAARRDLTIATNYLDVAARMDLANFIDYLLPLVWADNDDWPHNNTRAARERVPGARFRFYPWDAEFAFTSHGVSYDTIATTLSTLNPPWGTTDYQAMFNSLKRSPEFKLLFADRVHRAFFNDGPLTDARIRARYNQIKAQVAPSISGFNDLINSWINGRRRYITNSFAKAGFLASSNAPVANQFGGRVPAGFRLTLTNISGPIFYTTDGTDPRTPFTSTRSASAIQYDSPITVAGPLRVMARSLSGTNWSAIIDLAFEVSHPGSPIRFSEVMYNPPGGDPFEYVELINTGGLPADVSGFTFTGIEFRFATPFPLIEPGGRIVLANEQRPAEFQRRYPGVQVAGWFDAALNNGGERLELIDPAGRLVTSVEYNDEHPWPIAADGEGAALEAIDPLGDLNDPANWQASAAGGTPGNANGPRSQPRVVINELQAGASGDWVELFNPGASPVQLDNWSLTDNSAPRQFVFGSGTSIPAGGFLRIDCVQNGSPGPVTALFSLNRDGETIAFFDERTNRVDIVSFGPVVDGLTLGLVNGVWALCHPTIGGTNEPAELGSVEDLRINEFLANPDFGDDWLELHNIGDKPVDLRGLMVVTSNAVARIGRPAYVAEHSFVVLHADEEPGGDHLNLKLPASGGLIALLTPGGDELDKVTYQSQLTGMTFGRLPDGTGNFQTIPFSPTRGASNYLASLGTSLRISEVMARAVNGPDWVELENASTQAVSLASFSFGVNEPGIPRVALPLSSGELAPGARATLYFGTFSAGATPLPDSTVYERSLSDTGAQLSVHDSVGRIIDLVQYGLQLTGRSIGRAGGDWTLLDSPTPGEANAKAAPLDSGSTLRLNEWLAAGDGTNDFVEIHNPAALPVNLAGWVLTDDPSIYGATNNRIAPLNFIDAGGFVRFVTDNDPESGPDHTAFGLDLLGETIRLLSPFGQIVDSVDFPMQRAAVSEGRYPDGGTLIVRFAGSATPGAPNALPRGDFDGDGLDDSWEALNGLDPQDPFDATLDSDGDGYTNQQEYRLGTGPHDSESVFRVDITTRDGGEAQIEFVAQPARLYAIEFADQLAAPNWTRLAEVPGPETSRVVTVSDLVPPQTAHRFYRVRLVR